MAIIKDFILNETKLLSCRRKGNDYFCKLQLDVKKNRQLTKFMSKYAKKHRYFVLII